MFRNGIPSLAFLLAVCSQLAAATTIFDNLGGATGGADWTTGYLFDTFSTGDETFYLTSVTLKLKIGSSTDTGTWYVFLCSVDMTTKAYSVLAIIGGGSDSSLSTTGTDYTLTLTTPYELSADTRYVIALDGWTGDLPRWDWTTDTSGVGVADEYYGHITADGTLSYDSDSSGGYQMSVDGYYAPEPATIFLMGGPLLAVGLIRRRQHPRFRSLLHTVGRYSR